MLLSSRYCYILMLVALYTCLALLMSRNITVYCLFCVVSENGTLPILSEGSNMRQHLRVTHGVANLRERQLWVRFSRRKVTQPLRPCTLCGRALKHIRPHFANSHRDLSARKLRRTVRRFQWDITMERLRDLEASHPVVPMVTLMEPFEDSDEEQIPSAPSSSITSARSFTPAPRITPSHPVTPSHPITTPPSSPGARAAVEEIAEGLKEFVQCMGSHVEQSEGGPLFGGPASHPSPPPAEFSVDDFLLSLDRLDASYAGAGVVQGFDEERAAQAPIMPAFLLLLEDNSMDPLQWGEVDQGPRSPTLERI
ncbi:uncharacterized protein [Misgurnus anguillicaudatus]|uniref:uncharacterized protein isoform X2 n=1 Tax=Misgurnus anguillicaudatus TaxID=75329 RepID=UPI003CCF48A0